MISDDATHAWFCKEILPLEAALLRFIRRHWRDRDEIMDLRQEVYERALLGAGRELPAHAAHYLFTIARNHMINRARRARIISFDLVADLESVVIDANLLTPDRFLSAREELQKVQAGLERLPPRCREVIELRKVEGLSTREVAERLRLAVNTVEQQTVYGMRALVDFMLGGERSGPSLGDQAALSARAQRMSVAADLEEKAARFLMRRGEAQWSAQDQVELELWLNESLAHKAAFWRLEHGWAAADRMAAIASPRVLDRRWPEWLRIAMAASVLLILAAGALGLYILRPATSVQTRYATALGANLVLPLEDGSKVQLNTDSAVRTDIDGRYRSVWLDRGEAYFEVARDRSKPFIIHAGSRRVTVLGTRFAIRRDADKVIVSVLQGRVRMEGEDDSSPVGSVTVEPGAVAVAEGGSTLLVVQSVESIERNLMWRQGVLTFDGTPLSDVAAEFNRYNQRQLLVTDPLVAAVRIGGSFQTRNVDAFVRLMHDAYGFKVEESAESTKLAR